MLNISKLKYFEAGTVLVIFFLEAKGIFFNISNISKDARYTTNFNSYFTLFQGHTFYTLETRGTAKDAYVLYIVYFVPCLCGDSHLGFEVGTTCNIRDEIFLKLRYFWIIKLVFHCTTPIFPQSYNQK